MRWALIAVFGLAALGAWAMGFSEAGSLQTKIEPMPLPKLAMRPLPDLGKGAAVAAAKPAAATPAPAEKPAEKPAVAEKAPPPAPEKAPEKPAEKAPTKPTAEEEPALPPTKPAPAPVARPAPAPKPVAVAAAPKPAAEEAPPPAPKPAPKPQPSEDAPAAAAAAPSGGGGGEGVINLKASDTAEIVVDGRKVGPSPKLGYKLKAGKHKIRFDCYDENGNLTPGKVQVIDVQADGEQEVSYDCPFTQ
jgi:outer membrane biosynthesis protein TonB